MIPKLDEMLRTLNRHAGYIPCALLLIGAIAISYFAHQHATFAGDLRIYNWLQDIESPAFDASMKTINFMGIRVLTPFAVSFCVLALWLLRRRAEALFVGLSLLGYAFTLVVKVMIDRPRPPIVETETNWMLIPGPSFPSGHVMHFVLFYGLLVYLVPFLFKGRAAQLTLQIVLVLLIISAAPAVIYAGRHWPSDALGGYVIGGLFLAALIWGYRRFPADRLDQWYERTKAGVLRLVRRRLARRDLA